MAAPMAAPTMTASAMGIVVMGQSTLELTDSRVAGRGGATAFGIRAVLDESSIYVSLRDCSIVSEDGASNSYGFGGRKDGAGTGTVEIINSRIDSKTASIYAVNGFEVKVGHCYLNGASVSAGGGTVICRNVIDSGFALHTSTCP